jgi:hypothetical protein
MKVSHAAILCLFALVTLVGINLTGQEPNRAPMQKWEYLIKPGLETDLKQLGEQGWELVHIRAQGASQSQYDNFYFKRPLR